MLSTTISGHLLEIICHNLGKLISLYIMQWYPIEKRRRKCLKLLL